MHRQQAANCICSVASLAKQGETSALSPIYNLDNYTSLMRMASVQDMKIMKMSGETLAEPLGWEGLCLLTYIVIYKKPSQSWASSICLPILYW